jgi:hypothetical protein
MVFEGGRYRHSGEKYLTISRRSSTDSGISRDGSLKSLNKSFRSSRMTTQDWLPSQDELGSTNKLKSPSKPKFDVKVSTASLSRPTSKGCLLRDNNIKSSLFRIRETPRSSVNRTKDMFGYFSKSSRQHKTLADAWKANNSGIGKGHMIHSYDIALKDVDRVSEHKRQMNGRPSPGFLLPYAKSPLLKKTPKRNETKLSRLSALKSNLSSILNS